MKNNENNEEEQQLWSFFKKTAQKGVSPCLDDISLSAYLDGRQLWRKKGQMEEHLANCPDCLSKLIEMRMLLNIANEEVPFLLKQKAKDQVTGDFLEAEEGGLAWWKLILMPNRSLAWVIVSLLVLTSTITGIKFGGEIAMSPAMGVLSGQSDNLVESGSELLGVADVGGGL